MWANPWAWLGLSAIAVPIAVHLLARTQAVRERFPSMRFLALTDLTAIKRHRLTDLPILAARIAIVLAAVAALAGPRLGGVEAAADSLAVAVVVDTSASISAASAGAGLAFVRERAKDAVKGAASSIVIEAADLRAGLGSAAGWAARQPGRREVVVISDFQRGALDSAALHVVPRDAGLKMTVVPLAAPKLPSGLTLMGDATVMVWPPAMGQSARRVQILAGSSRPDAEAALAAASSVAGLAVVAGEPGAADADAVQVAVVFPDAPERRALAESLKPVSQPWMFELARPLLSDPMLRAHVVLGADAGGPGNSSRMVVLVNDAAASERSAAVLASVLRVRSRDVPPDELEPVAIAPEVLRSWERASTPRPPERLGEPQGRWFWVVALGLLTLEFWMRRRD
jgi:hypothetical protein